MTVVLSVDLVLSWLVSVALSDLVPAGCGHWESWVELVSGFGELICKNGDGLEGWGGGGEGLRGYMREGKLCLPEESVGPQGRQAMLVVVTELGISLGN